MTTIEPLRKLKARRAAARGPQGRPDPRVDLAMLVAFVVAVLVFRRRLGRAATERTGTWVGTIR